VPKLVNPSEYDQRPRVARILGTAQTATVGEAERPASPRRCAVRTLRLRDCTAITTLSCPDRSHGPVGAALAATRRQPPRPKSLLPQSPAGNSAPGRDLRSLLQAPPRSPVGAYLRATVRIARGYGVPVQREPSLPPDHAPRATGSATIKSWAGSSASIGVHLRTPPPFGKRELGRSTPSPSDAGKGPAGVGSRRRRTLPAGGPPR